MYVFMGYSYYHFIAIFVFSCVYFIEGLNSVYQTHNGIKDCY